MEITRIIKIIKITGIIKTGSNLKTCIMLNDTKELIDTLAQHEGGQPAGRGYTEEPPQAKTK